MVFRLLSEMVTMIKEEEKKVEGGRKPSIRWTKINKETKRMEKKNLFSSKNVFQSNLV